MQISFLTGETSISMKGLKEIVKTLKVLEECDDLTIGISERVRVTGVRVEIFYKNDAICYEINFYGRNPKTGRPGTVGLGRYSARQVRNLEFNDSSKE